MKHKKYIYLAWAITSRTHPLQKQKKILTNILNSFRFCLQSDNSVKILSVLIIFPTTANSYLHSSSLIHSDFQSNILILTLNRGTVGRLWDGRHLAFLTTLLDCCISESLEDLFRQFLRCHITWFFAVNILLIRHRVWNIFISIKFPLIWKIIQYWHIISCTHIFAHMHNSYIPIMKLSS